MFRRNFGRRRLRGRRFVRRWIEPALAGLFGALFRFILLAGDLRKHDLQPFAQLCHDVSSPTRVTAAYARWSSVPVPSAVVLRWAKRDRAPAAAAWRCC